MHPWHASVWYQRTWGCLHSMQPLLAPSGIPGVFCSPVLLFPRTFFLTDVSTHSLPFPIYSPFMALSILLWRSILPSRLFFLQPKTPLSVQFSSVAQSCPILCDPMNRSTPGLPVHHQLPEFIQTQVHRVSDAIQPSHPLASPSPPALNPSQHQSLFLWYFLSWNSNGIHSLNLHLSENMFVSLSLQRLFWWVLNFRWAVCS